MLGHARGVAVLAAVAAPACRSSNTRRPKIKAGRRRLRTRREDADAAHGEAAARPRHARRRRTTPPTRWPSRSATRTRARRAGARRAPAARAPRTCAAGVTSPRARSRAVRRRDRTSHGHAARKARAASDRRCRRRRLRRARPAVHVLHRRRPGLRASRCASTRTCARTRCSCSASRRALEHTLFERLIGVSGIGPKVALAVLSGIEPADLVARDSLVRPRAAHADPRRRQEDRRAARPRAEGSAAAGGDERSPSAPAAEGDDVRADLLSALANLGYQRATVEKTVDKVLRQSDDRRVRAAAARRC